MTALEQAQKQLNVKKVVYGLISWVDVEMPTLGEMEYLKRVFPVYPL